MIYIINTETDEYNSFYPNYYVNNDDSKNIIYYDDYLNVISPKDYAKYNINPSSFIGGSKKNRAVSKIDKTALFSGIQASKWELFTTIMRSVAIPLIGKNIITGEDNELYEKDIIKKEKGKPDIIERESFTTKLLKILTKQNMIVYFNNKKEKTKRYYSFTEIDSKILKSIIDSYIIYSDGNETQKAFISENKAVRCLNFFCPRFAKFDDPPKQRQECSSCANYRTDPEKHNNPAGWQIEYEPIKKGDIDIYYFKLLEVDVMACYTNMCHNNFNPSYWIKPDGTMLTHKINGKTPNEDKETDENGNLVYKFTYMKPLLAEKRITGQIPILKDVPKKDKNDKTPKDPDIYLRKDGKIQFKPISKEQKIWKKFIKGRIKNQELLVNGTPYRCELTRPYKSYGKGIIELDHKDGDHHNNVISNIEPLCRICHGIKTDLQLDKVAGEGENYKNIEYYKINLEGTLKIKNEYLTALITEKLYNMNKAFYIYNDATNTIINDRGYVFTEWGYLNTDDDAKLLGEIIDNFTKQKAINKEKGKINKKKYKEEQDEIISMAMYEERPYQKDAPPSIQQVILDKSQDEQKAIVDIVNIGKEEIKDEAKAEPIAMIAPIVAPIAAQQLSKAEIIAGLDTITTKPKLIEYFKKYTGIKKLEAGIKDNDKNIVREYFRTKMGELLP
jgi:hypothetical protein